MTIFEKLNLLDRVHNMIKMKATGTPEELAQKIGYSERQTLSNLSIGRKVEMINFYFLLSFFLFSSPALAQDFKCFFLGKDLAKQMMERNNFSVASRIYNKLKFLNPPDPDFYLNSAKCNFTLGRLEDGMSDIRKSIRRGCLLDEILKEEIDSILSKENWHKLLDVVRLERSYYVEAFDFELFDRISRMYFNEQYVRRNIDKKKECHIDFMEQVDSLNFEELKIILQDGFPSYNRIGRVGVSRLQVILLHLGGLENIENFKFIKKVVYDAMTSLMYRPIDYALFMDRRLFYWGGKGKYGTILYRGGIIPVERIDGLDKIRRGIGLYSLRRKQSMTPRLKKMPLYYKEEKYSWQQLLIDCRH